MATSDRRSVLRIAIGVSVAMLLPIIGLFCWQWSVYSTQRGKGTAATPHNVLQDQNFQPHAPTFAQQLKAVANPRFAEITLGPSDPFQTELDREMIEARGNPFLFAHQSGISEGALVLQRQDGNLRTYTIGMAYSAGLSKHEILTRIDGRLMGSFSKFFSSVMTPSQSVSDPRAEEGEEAASEDNPFLDALEDLGVATPVETQEVVPQEPEIKQEPQIEGSEPPEPNRDPSTTTNETLAGKISLSGAGSRKNGSPYLVMRVEDGELISVSVSRSDEGVFESAELDLGDFNILPFTDPADFRMSLAIADFNRDSLADVALHVPQQRRLRFFYQDQAGKFEEGIGIDASRTQSSLAVDDYDQDGWADLAMSDLGTGLITLLYSESGRGLSHFKTFYLDTYRDYITFADSKDGSLNLLGMNYSNLAVVLLRFDRPEPYVSEGEELVHYSSFDHEITATNGRSSRINAAVMSGNLSVNLENRKGELVNVLTVVEGADVYVVVGDLDDNGQIDIGIATPR